MTPVARRVIDQFRSEFGTRPLLIRSPGRVNLIGEHTDYNDGFVLPAAIDKAIILAMLANGGSQIRLRALDMPSHRFEADLSQPLERSPSHWPNYVMGVVDEFRKAGFDVQGFDCVIGGDIPIGAGLSSSAAIEGGIGLGLATLFGHDVSRPDLARIGQRAENGFVGMNCGIMDQFANLLGQDGHVIRLDCRDLSYVLVPFDRTDIRIVLFDSKVRRELASSEYNVRRAQCEEGVRILSAIDPNVRSLREVSPELLASQWDALNEIVRARCRFILEENDRVLSGCRDLIEGDFEAFGRRMRASHAGLRDDYQVSCTELDLLEEATRGLEGVFGSRMMGGGFGGCTINLIHEDAVTDVSAQVRESYRLKTGIEAGVHVARIAAGTRVEDL